MHEVRFFLYLLAINSKVEICLILIAFFINDIMFRLVTEVQEVW
jgi:hypothetical protein